MIFHKNLPSKILKNCPKTFVNIFLNINEVC